MSIKLNRVREPIKNGWSSRAVAPRVAAHGRSPELADLNLERVVRLYLAPFERAGTLESEVTALGLQVVNDGALNVILSDEAAPGATS